VRLRAHRKAVGLRFAEEDEAAGQIHRTEVVR
jgi:hypothetical protein